MSKAVLISVRSERCEKIASGQKTIEVRKKRPKIETPFKCYIYCTEGKLNDDLLLRRKGYVDKICNGKVIGEFVCNRIEEFESEFYSDDSVFNAIYRVVEDEDYPDVLTAIASNEDDSKNFWICTQSCLSFDEIKEYVGYDKSEKTFYGWHISDLVIYDKPKELNEFMKPCPADHNCFDCAYHHPWFDENGKCEYKNISGNIKRPPQSWCYVEQEDKQ